MKRRIAAVLFTLALLGCSTPTNNSGVHDACSQFAGAKRTRCEGGMTQVSSAVDQYNNGG